MEIEDPDYYMYDLPQENMKEESAPFWRRTMAFLIDLLVHNFLFYGIFIEVFMLTSGLRGGLLNYDYLLLHPELINAMFGVLVASSVIFCFYMALSEYAFGFTVGKMFMGLWVTGKPGLWGFVARNLLKSTLILFLPLDLIGLFFFKRRLVDLSLSVNVLYEEKIRLTQGFM